MTSKNIANIIIKRNKLNSAVKKTFGRLHPVARIESYELHKIDQRFSNS